MAAYSASARQRVSALRASSLPLTLALFAPLGAELTAANSPQAKGRVERNHALDHDRLVKELRLAGISTIEVANEEANKFLN
jgi:hypothetical protein